MGISFVVLTLVASFLRFQNIARQAGVVDNVLVPHDAFQVRIADRLSIARSEPEPFLVMVFAADHRPPLTGQQDEKAGEELLDEIQRHMQIMLRGTDTVIPIGGGRIGAIVDAAREDAENIAQRLLHGVRKELIACSSGQAANLSVSAGIATHPENGNRVMILMDKAMSSLQAAVLKGHGQFVLTAIEGVSRPLAPPPAPSGGVSQAVLDPLTGVLRPERLNTALQKWVAHYRKQEAPLSILVLEVDHFERYSKHYGRSAGDEILRGFGEFLRNVTRKSDLIGRSGEETFLIAMGCAPRDAMVAARRIISAVKKIAFPVGGSSLRITLSLGVAGYPDHGSHPRQLREAATAALQAAQENGRSRGMMYEPSMRVSKKSIDLVDVF